MIYYKYMKKPLISIIIPIYNAETYLEECLNSIINQTYKNIEIVAINDGSNDKSLDMLNRFSSKDKRIKVYTKENGGVSSSRNYALEKVSGDYIMFVDSDDYLTNNNVIQDLVNELDGYDVIRFGNYNLENNTITENKQIYKLDNEYESGIDFINKVLNNIDTYGWYLWQYIFSKELWDNIKFPEGRIFEDTCTIYKTLLNANKIKTITTPIYTYRYNSISLSKKINLKICKDMIDTIIESSNYVLNLDIPNNTKELLLNNFSYSYISVVNAIYIIDKKDRKELKTILKNNKHLLDNCKYGSSKSVKTMIDIFGINVTAYLLNIRRILRNKI